MNDIEINRISVIGSGLRGHGIVLDFALAGYSVLMHSRSEDSLKRGLQSIEESLARLQTLGRISESDAELTRSRIATTTSMAVAVSWISLISLISAPAIKILAFPL